MRGGPGNTVRRSVQYFFIQNFYQAYLAFHSVCYNQRFLLPEVLYSVTVLPITTSLTSKNNRNIWRSIKNRLIDIDRQTVEAECAGKTILVVHAELKLEQGREKYINYCIWMGKRGGHCLAAFGGMDGPSSEKREWYTSMSFMQRAGQVGTYRRQLSRNGTAKMATPAGEISHVGTQQVGALGLYLGV